ncbi:MAG: extracellular solute-binding protein [Spirochaetia bacterium]|nr:extracellular solute-binding protein [Spirochaetia bacterium]
MCSVVVLIVLLGSMLVVSCTKEESKRVLYLYNWTYYTPQSIIKQFEKEFDARVVIDNYASNEAMFAKLKASHGGYDIVVPSADYTSIMIKLDMLEKLDHEKLPNLAHINKKAYSLSNSYDPEFAYSVPYFIGAAGVAVNTEYVNEYEKDWSIFANSEYKGRMQLLDDMNEVMGIALTTLGYSVNSIDMDELEEAGRLINDQWKPNIVKFDAEGVGKAFSQGEFWISHAYPEVIFEEVPKKKWKNIDFFLPQNGGPLYIDSMVILKGSKNSDLAHEFINFFHRPEIHALFLDEFNYPSSVNKAADKYRESVPFYDQKELDNYELKVDLGKDLEKYQKVWQTIRYH